MGCRLASIVTGWAAAAFPAGTMTAADGLTRSPGSSSRSSEGQVQAARAAGSDSWPGQHFRQSGGRRPGAHRASKSSRLIPGRRRGAGRSDPGTAAVLGSRSAVTGDLSSRSLVRSSAVMALGTLASRVTGMLRTIVLVPALGPYALANAYSQAVVRAGRPTAALDQACSPGNGLGPKLQSPATAATFTAVAPSDSNDSALLMPRARERAQRCGLGARGLFIT
jgi:hypothetical protein